MGKTWDFMLADPQLRWCVQLNILILSIHREYLRIGPEKGVIHIASGAVNNALWDMYARSRKKPLWKLLVDFTPVRRCSSYHDGA
jgi:L-fuconate dehydratase